MKKETQTSRLQLFFVKNSDGFMNIVFVLSLIWFTATFFQCAVFSGRVYCSDYTCDVPVKAPFSQLTLIIVGVCFYVVILIICLIALFSPGYWHPNPKQSKAYAMIVLTFLPVSGIQLIVPEVHRGYVFTYYTGNRYSIEITQLSGNSARMNVSNYYSSYVDGMDAMVAVFEATGDEEGVFQLSTVAKEIYRDKDKGQYFKVDSSIGDIIRDISHLEDGKYYMWTVLPAKIISDKSYVADLPWSGSKYSYTFSNLKKITGGFLDRRAYRLCKWHSSYGCSDSIHS
ncbi:hypothetical protein M0811_14417 [Anaeramoeba ignava]|uniref:Uncharacterized protein n=1 Tax=Anaeramoeba ignava TaxID=1746090 RepID=A0A9Q0LUZ8_ANAIG|nr:hypothetical protein M0811_14417 [Anaeramoeba ignava]|eukprot:Anaeramoba_ignava/a478904_62.p1 GENE.a478904_62~~a478904_62.p1  ORF type:complete len:285 (-),score=48.44 a478904_62:55-909(-)